VSKDEVKVPRRDVVTIMEVLRTVLASPGISGVRAIHDLWKVSGRPDYRIPAQSALLLHKHQLVDQHQLLPEGWATVRLSAAVRTIVRAAVRIEGPTGTVIVRPIPDVLREIAQ